MTIHKMKQILSILLSFTAGISVIVRDFKVALINLFQECIASPWMVCPHPPPTLLEKTSPFPVIISTPCLSQTNWS